MAEESISSATSFFLCLPKLFQVFGCQALRNARDEGLPLLRSWQRETGPACKVNCAGHGAKIKYGGTCLEVFCWM